MRSGFSAYKLWIITITIAFYGCERSVILELPATQSKLVINSVNQSSRLINMSVGKSKGILTTPSPDIQSQQQNNAINKGNFLLYANDILIDTIQFDINKGAYAQKRQFPGIVKKFTITGNTPGLPAINASSLVPQEIALTVENYRVKARKIIDGSFVDEVTISFNDPANEKNFYWINFLSASGINTWSAGACLFSKDKDIEQPVGDITSAILDNCLTSALVVDKNFNGTKKSIVFEIPSSKMKTFENLQTGTITRPLIRLEHITEDYYRYLKSRTANSNSSDNPFAEPVNLFTNVNNGYGIFTFYTTSEKEIK